MGELAGSPAQPARIMLIEDDTLIRENLSEILTLEGYEVVTAVDGLDALAQLQSEPTPDLVITDLQMPRANGWVVALELRREPLFASIPLVVISGVHDTDSAGGFLGAAATFQKPFDVPGLLETLHRLLETRRQEPQPESKEE